MSKIVTTSLLAMVLLFTASNAINNINIENLNIVKL